MFFWGLGRPGGPLLVPGTPPAGQLHVGTAARQVHHPHIPPPDALPDAGAERLGTGLLGGEPLGIGRNHHLLAVGAPRGPGALGVGEDAVEEAIAVALDHLGDPGDVDQVGADADDHARPAIFWRPRSIAERICRTVSPRPTNNASPIMK